MRNYTWLDKCIIGFTQTVQTSSLSNVPSARHNPADEVVNHELTSVEKSQSAALMRVNHSGEVCAQALYMGQAMTARLTEVRAKMAQSAAEELDHLAWCQQRISELGGHTSYLNPFWYGASLTIGAFAGLVGDDWSLGFVAETENQVVRHLRKHLTRLPKIDDKSRAILTQMVADEQQHATIAIAAGARELPETIKKLMGLVSKVMTRTCYYV